MNISNTENFLISIDGPAGSGKSTICELIAKRLGFTHIDTGSMYRAVTLYALNKKLDLNDEKIYDFIDNIEITQVLENIYLNGKDITKEIRSKKVTENVSLVSSFTVVRKRLVRLQKELAHGLIIMDGRDIGSVVLPHADIKIFLTADSKTRAFRRLLQKNIIVTEESLEKEEANLNVRDKYDSTRSDSPLVIPKNAIIIDATNRTIDQVVTQIIEIILEKRGKSNG